MATSEVGSLIVTLRMNSAEFKADADEARANIEKVGHGAHSAGAGFTHLTAILTREFLPGLGVSIRELQLLIRTAMTAVGALGLLAGVVLTIGAAVGAFALGNYIRNFIDLTKQGYSLRDAFDLARGSTTRWEKALKEANEEQTKFIEQMQKTRLAVLEADKALSDATGKRDIARAKASGTEGDVAFQEYKAAVAQIENSKKIAAAQIAADKTSAEARAYAFKKLDETVNAQRETALLEYNAAYRKLAEQQSKAQFQLWQDETQLLMGELQKRLKARQEFEAQLGKGGIGGTTVEGLGEVGDWRRQIQRSARDLAGELRTGAITQSEYWDALNEVQSRAYEDAFKLYQKWGQFPTVMRVLGQQIDDMAKGYGQLDTAMAEATNWAQQYLDTNAQLAARQQQLAESFAKVPETTGTAGVAVRKLADEYNELAWQAAGATQQIYNAAAAMVYFHSVGG